MTQYAFRTSPLAGVGFESLGRVQETVLPHWYTVTQSWSGRPRVNETGRGDEERTERADD